MSRLVRPLDEGDLDAWIRIRDASFGTRDASRETQLALLRERLPWSIGAEVDGRLSVVSTWFPYPFWIGGSSVPTGALAGVASAPEGRRRGHVRAVVLDGLRRLHEAGIGLSLEHPFDPRFYAAVGYRSLPAGTSLDGPVGRLAGDAKRVDFRPASSADGPRLARIQAAFARRRSFTVDRSWRAPERDPLRGPLWERVLDADAPFDPFVPYLVDGGYAIVSTGRLDGTDVLEVQDVAWVDGAARERVLDLLGAWRGQVERMRIDLPSDDPLAMDEGPRHGMRRPSLQARIVDLEAALRPLRTFGTGGARRVRVRDADLPWNDGTWKITVGPDGTEAARATGAAEAEVSVAALISLLSGTPPAVLADRGEVQGDPQALWDLFASTANHPPFLGGADYF